MFTTPVFSSTGGRAGRCGVTSHPAESFGAEAKGCRVRNDTSLLFFLQLAAKYQKAKKLSEEKVGALTEQLASATTGQAEERENLLAQVKELAAALKERDLELSEAKVSLLVSSFFLSRVTS